MIGCYGDIGRALYRLDSGWLFCNSFPMRKKMHAIDLARFEMQMEVRTYRYKYNTYNAGTGLGLDAFGQSTGSLHSDFQARSLRLRRGIKTVAPTLIFTLESDQSDSLL